MKELGNSKKPLNEPFTVGSQMFGGLFGGDDDDDDSGSAFSCMYGGPNCQAYLNRMINGSTNDFFKSQLEAMGSNRAANCDAGGRICSAKDYMDAIIEDKVNDNSPCKNSNTCTIYDVINSAITNVTNSTWNQGNVERDSGYKPDCIDNSSCTITDLINVGMTEQIYHLNKTNKRCYDANNEVIDCNSEGIQHTIPNNHDSCIENGNCNLNDLINSVLSGQFRYDNYEQYNDIHDCIKNNSCNTGMFIDILLNKILVSFYNEVRGNYSYGRTSDGSIVEKGQSGQWINSDGNSVSDTVQELYPSIDNILLLITNKINKNILSNLNFESLNIPDELWPIITDIINLFLDTSFREFIQSLLQNNLITELMSNPENLNSITDNLGALLNNFVNDLHVENKQCTFETEKTTCSTIENLINIIATNIDLTNDPKLSSKVGIDRVKNDLNLYIHDIVNNYFFKCPLNCKIVSYLNDNDLIESKCVNEQGEICDVSMGKIPNLVKSFVKEIINDEFTNCGPPDNSNTQEICMGFDNYNDNISCLLQNPDDNCSPPGEQWNQCIKKEIGTVPCKSILNQGLCYKAGCQVDYTGTTMQTITKGIDTLENKFINKKNIIIVGIILIILLLIPSIYSFIQLLRFIF